MKKTWIWLAVSLVVTKISLETGVCMWVCCLNAAIALVVTAFKAENAERK